MKVVDLFCGCGGFSLGAKNAGFDVALSVDIDLNLTSSYEHNFPGANLVLKDVGEVSGADCLKLANSSIDGVIGGPPCQGFSSIGKRSPDDPRRSLLGQFFRVVSEVKPKFFVMENVKGVTHGHSASLLKQGIEKVRTDYNVTDPIVLDAADFGAATKRPRVFVIGFRNESGLKFSKEHLNRYRRAPATVRDAIADLANSKPTMAENGFDVWKLDGVSGLSSYASELRSDDARFTGNARTKHTEAVRMRFNSVGQGRTDPVGRHPRLCWVGQAPTLRAGTGSDRGSFQSVRPIHPDEPRVITVREAARLQGFPDEFRFHPTIWHSFRMIGNSVSPIQACAVLSAIRDQLVEANEITPSPRHYFSRSGDRSGTPTSA